MANAKPVHNADSEEGVKAPSVNVQAPDVKVPEVPKADIKPASKKVPKLDDNQTLLPDGTIRTES